MLSSENCTHTGLMSLFNHDVGLPALTYFLWLVMMLLTMLNRQHHNHIQITQAQHCNES